MAIFTLCIYVMFKDYKRCSFYAMAKIANTDYQKFQYFLSDSKWNLQALKNKRLEIIENQLTTCLPRCGAGTAASTKDGILAIDDTGCPKPFAKKTQGAKWQYCGPLKREEICNVAVASTFVSQSKHFPVDIIPYLPADDFKLGENDTKFKSKIDIAKDLSKYANVRNIKDAELVEKLVGRVCVVDGQEFLVGLTDDAKTHPTQDVALWTQSSHASSNVFGPMFDLVWHHAKPVK